MQRTQRVVERLPEFYRSRDQQSVIYKLVDAFARSLNEQQQDIFRIARTHWVETAHHSDLDRLAEVFELTRLSGESDGDYRMRLKSGVQQFRGGGTRESIVTIVSTFLKVRRSELVLEENPEVTLAATHRTGGDGEWVQGSMSIADAAPAIEITVETEEGRIIDPSLAVKETGAWVRYNGTVVSGQRLVIEGARAELDGSDVSDRLERNGDIALLRSGSTWVFHEALSSRLGTFDHATFDASAFQKAVPIVSIRFQWTSRQPSTFELTVPYSALERSGSSPEEVEELLDTIRAQGVRSTLRIKE